VGQGEKQGHPKKGFEGIAPGFDGLPIRCNDPPQQEAPPEQFFSHGNQDRNAQQADGNESPPGGGVDDFQEGVEGRSRLGPKAFRQQGEKIPFQVEVGQEDPEGDTGNAEKDSGQDLPVAAHQPSAAKQADCHDAHRQYAQGIQQRIVPGKLRWYLGEEQVEEKWQYPGQGELPSRCPGGIFHRIIFYLRLTGFAGAGITLIRGRD
jgi:hypothetical protein